VISVPLWLEIFTTKPGSCFGTVPEDFDTLHPALPTNH
jgi:hypothetical protein